MTQTTSILHTQLFILFFLFIVVFIVIHNFGIIGILIVLVIILRCTVSLILLHHLHVAAACWGTVPRSPAPDSSTNGHN